MRVWLQELWLRTTTSRIRMKEWEQQQQALKCKASRDPEERGIVGQRSQIQN